MPTEQKAEVIAKLKSALDANDVAILTNPRGLSTPDLNALRAKLRDIDASFVITKNTLLRIAAERSGVTGLEPLLNQESALALGGTRAQEVAKVLSDHIRVTRSPMVIKGGILGGAAITVEQVQALVTLAPKPDLQAKLAGTIQGPLASMIGVINAALGELVGVLDAREQQLGESA